MPGQQTENHCAKEIIHKSFVPYFGAGLSSNCGNHVYSTFLPAWVNLVWCLLGLRKSAPLEDNCPLRYFLMLQSSRNGYTFYSATGFEQQAFHTCPQRIQNSSIWEKSNLIPILAQPLNPLLLQITENASSTFCVTDKKVHRGED